jgi:rhodanese-related sulfurtransferase
VQHRADLQQAPRPVVRGAAGVQRGVVRAAALATLALVPEALHGAEDVRAGIGPAPALVVALLVGALACVAALRGRRWGARLLLAVSAGWVLAALVDHPAALTDPAGFRDGWSSALAVWALVVLNVGVAAYAAVASMPASWEALKAAPAEVASDDVVVLDVRTSRERAGGAIPGAVRGSWRDPRAPAAGPVLVVCSHGGRALIAARTLRAAGVDARSLRGGMRAYRRAGLPLDGGASAAARRRSARHR